MEASLTHDGHCAQLLEDFSQHGEEMFQSLLKALSAWYKHHLCTALGDSAHQTLDHHPELLFDNEDQLRQVSPIGSCMPLRVVLCSCFQLVGGRSTSQLLIAVRLGRRSTEMRTRSSSHTKDGGSLALGSSATCGGSVATFWLLLLDAERWLRCWTCLRRRCDRLTMLL